MVDIGIGIDFGFSTIRVGIIEHNNIIQIMEFSNCFRFTDENSIQIGKDNSNSFFGINHILGRYYSYIRNDIKYFYYNIKEESNKPLISIRIDENKTKYCITEEIIAYMFEHIYKHIIQTTGNIINCITAVVSVPCAFTSKQRKALLTGSKLSNITVRRLLSSTLARSMVSFTNIDDDNTVLIIDIGGGSINVGKTQIDGRIFESITEKGDSNFGGINFDRRILNYLISNYSLHIEDNQCMTNLLIECERVKCNLSNELTSEITFTTKNHGIELNTTISRQEFENICEDLFYYCLSFIENCYTTKSMFQHISHILVSGGTTLIPKLQSMIRLYFKDKVNITFDNKTDNVMKGCTIMGAILSNLTNLYSDYLTISTCGNDIFYKSLPLFKYNTSIPSSETRKITTNENNQAQISIYITTKCDTDLIDEYIIQSIFPAPKGVPNITIEFLIDANGIITLNVYERSMNYLITVRGSNNLTNEVCDKLNKKVSQVKIN